MSTKVRPTRRIFLNGVRYFNKYIFNRFPLWFAKRGWGPFSVLTHKGRKTNRLYTTPVLAMYSENQVFIPLPYGERVDWLRNILSQGGCEIYHKGETFSATDPIVLDSQSVFPNLPQSRRDVFERFDVEKFLQLSKSSK